MAKQSFFRELNKRKKKDDKIHYLTEMTEELRMTETDRGDGSPIAITTGPWLIPHHERIVDGQEDYTYQDKLSMLSERFLSLKPIEWSIKLPSEEAVIEEMPWVEEVLLNPDTILKTYIKATQPQAIPLDVAQERLKQKERTFLGKEHSPCPSSKRKKKSVDLHPQE